MKKLTAKEVYDQIIEDLGPKTSINLEMSIRRTYHDWGRHQVTFKREYQIWVTTTVKGEGKEWSELVRGESWTDAYNKLRTALAERMVEEIQKEEEVFNELEGDGKVQD